MPTESLPIDLRNNSREALNNASLRLAMRKATAMFTSLREGGLRDLPVAEWRDRASAIRNQVLDDLESFVDQFASNATRAGAVVHRAKDANDGANIILELLKDNGVQKLVKSKSMISEEIHLNHLLETNNIRAVETDLGEFIIQLAGETPSHILGPAIHKNRKQIGRLFSEKLGVDYSEDRGALAKTAGKILRQEFLTANAGFSGANFAIAESGSLVIFTNEGNGRMCTTVPPLHIAALSIEKILPSFKDLSFFSGLLTRSATGQPLSSYMSVMTGTRKGEETTGAKKLHIVLLDNGRSRILKGPFRDILKCIRCSACMNYCPVYRAIGGHAYESVYPGPMGVILTNLLEGFDRAHTLLDASTLCGACDEVCPVKIPLSKLILSLREQYANSDVRSLTENMFMTVFGEAASHPALFGIAQQIAATALPVVQRVYKEGRLDRLPEPAKKTFKERKPWDV